MDSKSERLTDLSNKTIKFPLVLMAVAGTLLSKNDPTVQSAELTTSAVLVGLAVASYAAAYFLRPRPKTATSSKIDGTPTSLSLRGATCPVINGFRRIPLIFAGTWDRRVEEIVQETEQSGGGKGMFGGSNDGKQTQTKYFEGGLHVCLTGPVNRLHRIVDRGEVIWAGPIDSVSTPSGSSVTTKIGTFYIYWGETDQPPNPRLAESHRLGVYSRWPGFCYIEWIDTDLGDSPTWRALEYEFEVDAIGPALSKSKQYLVSTVPSAKNSGLNYAHSIYQLWTAPWPLGMGKDPSTLNFESLEQLGIVCQEENTPVNWIADGTDSVGTILTDLMSDHDFFMVQEGHKMAFRSIRPATGPQFSRAQLTSDPPSIKYPQGSSPASSTAFFIVSRTQAFSRVEVRSQDSGERAMYSRQKPAEITLDTVIDGVTANKIADRKESQAFSTQASYRLGMLGAARRLTAGGVFVMEDMGPLRVLANQLDSDSQKCVVTCTYDAMSEASTGYVRPETSVSEQTIDPVPDLVFRPIEIPTNFAGERILLGVLRARGANTQGASSIQTSVGGSSFTTKGLQSAYCATGLLTEAMAAGPDRILESGPLFTSANGDISQALDLSGDKASWLSGKQALLIDDEIMFVEKLEADSSGFRPINVARGRCGTSPRAHAIGSRVFLFAPSSMTAFSDAAYQLGAEVQVKSVPSGLEGSSIAPVGLSIKGVALAPWAPSQVRVLRKSNLPSYAVASFGADYIEIAGSRLEEFKPGQYVCVFQQPNDVQSFYLVKSVQIVASNTRVTFYQNLIANPTGYKVNLARFDDRWDQDLYDVYYGWSTCNRSSLSAAGRQAYGAGTEPSFITEGDYVISICDENEVLIREMTSPVPFLRDTIGYGLGKHVIRVCNRIGGYRSQESRTIIQEE